MTELRNMAQLMPPVQEAQQELLIDRDRYFKKMALSSVVSLVITVAAAIGQTHFGAIEGIMLATSAGTGAAAYYHYSKRRNELNTMGIKDSSKFRWHFFKK